MIKLKIKTGDMVKVMTGSSKGKTGKVLQSFPKLGRVVVEGVNSAKRHVRSRSSGQKGQIVDFFMPINVSNVMPIDDAGKTVRHDDKPKA
jgi:large subunit ribosomal protein L24